MDKRQLTPELPTYESGRRFVVILNGVRERQYKSMYDEIKSHIGNPKNITNWKDPEEWIPQRLSGENRDLALRLWRESDQILNPRHTFGHIYLCRIHELFSIQDGVFHISERGAKFLENDEDILESIDKYEGLHLLLREIAETGPEKRRSMMEAFATFCRSFTTLRAYSSIDMAHSYAVRNLLQRKLIEKTGHTYQITDSGLKYLGRFKDGDAENGTAIEELIKEKNAGVRQQLTEFLQSMNPYQFEHLIKLLLETMGYEALVTAAGNDKGVDVVAEIELGISRVKEVIQAKRFKGNIGRPILDQLRGSLHYFQAMRGTIITTGGFTKGTKEAAFLQGAAPITLIDGETLVNLLIEHDIGIRRREIRVLEFDADSLSEFQSERELEAASLD